MLKTRITESFVIKYHIIAGTLWTVPELLFESKKLIPALQQLLTGG